MRASILFVLAVLFSAASSTVSEKPVQVCYDSSADCALFLVQNSRADFVVDNAELLAAVRAIKPETFHIGVRQVSPESKREMENAARETDDIIRVMNEDLNKLAREGNSALDGGISCDFFVAACGVGISQTIGAASKNQLLLSVLAMVGSTISCIQAAKGCSEATSKLEEFREDFKTWEAKQRLAGRPTSSLRDPTPHERARGSERIPESAVTRSGGCRTISGSVTSRHSDGTSSTRLQRTTICGQ